MKLKSTLAASLFAIAAALSLNVIAASDIPADAKTEKVDAQKPQKQVKPQTHMEEHMAMMSADKEAKAESTTPAKVNPLFDKTRHFHPRDGGK
jgi:hypothetical protein